jgi:exonuclease VII small subunit
MNTFDVASPTFGTNLGGYFTASANPKVNVGLYSNGVGTLNSLNYGIVGEAIGLNTQRNIGVFGRASGASVDNLAGYFEGNVGVLGTLLLDGNLQASGNITALSVTETSDVRLKTNILPLNNALANLMKMRGVTYNWLDKTKPQGNQIGVIAQEVEAIYPEFVHTDDKGMKSVNYSQMVAVLIEAIKELNTKVATLETENSTLKASVAKVETIEQQLKQIQAMLGKAGAAGTLPTNAQQEK